MSEIRSKYITAYEYNYQALENASYVRPTELLPTEAYRNRHIHCSIHHMNLDTPTHSYVALSYVWGDPVLNSKRIYINGNLAFLVTTILHSALARLRSNSKSFFLWVDAICANQANDATSLAECSAQVFIRSKIYSSTEKVVIDLGHFPTNDKIIEDGLTIRIY
jgi:Heterokaryon incompatibility protein (HET)